MKDLISKIKNAKDYENLNERLGKDLGSLIYELVERSELSERIGDKYALFFMNVMDGADPNEEAKVLGLI